MIKLNLEEVAYRVLPRVEAGRALADVEWLTLVNVADVLKVGAPVNIESETVANNVEDFLIAGRSRRTWRVRVLLTLINGITLATHHRPFNALSLRERRELIESNFMHGRHVWGLCAKVRYLVTMGVYGDPRAVEATGYVPVEERRRFSRRADAPIPLRVRQSQTYLEQAHA